MKKLIIVIAATFFSLSSMGREIEFSRDTRFDNYNPPDLYHTAASIIRGYRTADDNIILIDLFTIWGGCDTQISGSRHCSSRITFCYNPTSTDERALSSNLRDATCEITSTLNLGVEEGKELTSRLIENRDFRITLRLGDQLVSRTTRRPENRWERDYSSRWVTTEQLTVDLRSSPLRFIRD